MAILGEIRKRPILLMGIIAVALLAFLVNPDTFDKLFGKNPSIMGKVNGDEITRDEYNDQLFVIQQQAQQQNQPSTGLEEQAWQILVQSKLIKQQFEKMGFTMTDDFFWSQLQYDPMFTQNPSNFDEKGNFKLQEIKKQVEELKASGQVEAFNQWSKTRKSIEYRMMYKEISGNVTAGITVSKKEAQELMKQRDELADIDYVQINYDAYNKKNPTKVTSEDLTNYIKRFPNTYKTDPSVNLGVVLFPATPSVADENLIKNDIQKLFDGVAPGTENFQNTTNDSMFVSLNSEAPFSGQYVSAEQLPPSIGNWAKTAAKSYIGAIEIVDLRSISPWDRELVFESVKRHGKCLIITEESIGCSFARGVAGTIQNNCFEFLDAPIDIIGSEDLPAIPLNSTLEFTMIPNADKVSKAIDQLLKY